MAIVYKFKIPRGALRRMRINIMSRGTFQFDCKMQTKQILPRTLSVMYFEFFSYMLLINFLGNETTPEVAIVHL